MIGVVLVTHGRLACEFRAALEHVVGPQEQFEVVTIGPDDTVEELATRMNEREESHVPVVNADGRLVGIVARGDIVKFIARTT